MPIGLEHVKIKFLVNGVIFVVVYFTMTLFVTFNKQERTYYLNTVLTLLHIKPRKKAIAAETNEVKNDGE